MQRIHQNISTSKTPYRHRIVRLFLLGLFLLAQHGSAHAGTSGTLEGRITDKERGGGIIGVQIFLLGTMYGSSTDTAGYFHIGNIRAGTYAIRCSMIGYKTVIVKDVTVLPDIRNELNVKMEQSPLELIPVEITADQPMIEKDQPVTAFSVGELKVSQLPVSTIGEILALEPSTTAEGNVRGGKTTDVLYLVDGLPMQDVIGGGAGGVVPQNAISGMTIFTGGYEAEYGNALSGVVNIVTKSSTDCQSILVRAEKDNLFPNAISDQYDRYNQIELTASGPIASERLSYFAAGTYIATDTRWWSDFDHFFNSPVSAQWNGIGKLEYAFSPESRLSIQGVFDNRNWRDYEYSWRYNLVGLPPEHRASNRVAALFSTMLTPRTYYTLSLSRYSLESTIGDAKSNLTLRPYEYDIFLQYIISGLRNWWEDTRQTIWTLKGDLTNEAIGAHYFKVGFEVNRYGISSDLVKLEPQLTYFGKPIVNAPLLNYSTAYNYVPWSGSVFAQDKVRIDEQGSQLSFGLRWDFFDPRAQRPVVEFIPTGRNQYNEHVAGLTQATFKQQLSPRIAISTSSDPTTFIFANFGQYLQFPLFTYLYSGLTPAEVKQGVKNVLTGNPDLEPERTTQWELGVKHSLSPHMLISATYFRKSIENQVDTKTLVPSDSKFAGDYGYGSYINNAAADANGLELVLSRENDEQLSGSISYTFMSTEGTSEYANQRLNISQWGFALAPVTFPLSWDQQHTFKIDLLTHLPFGIEANAVLLYNSARPYTYYPTRDGVTPQDTSKPFIPNNARMFDALFVNLKVQKRFSLDAVHLHTLTVYFDGRNILDKANVRWMDSNGKIGGELSDPGAYYDPRRARVGMTIEY